MKKPNIILISIDTLRADFLSCYGYNKETTPNIDQLAAEGTIYLNNFSTGVWTPPGHASMLTGLYVQEHGVYGDNRLADNIPTIATLLKENSYQTSGFVNNSQVGELVGFEKGHDIFVEVWKGIKPKSFVERFMKGVKRRMEDKLGFNDMGAKRTNELFSRWIENEIDRNKPFYTFLHYIEPHNPLNPPAPYKNRYLSEKSFKKINKNKIEKVAHNPLICFVENINLNEEEKEYLKTLYAEEIAYVDSKVGEIVETLKSKDLYNNTMIIITSDHGEHFGEHNLWSHAGSLYNEVLHIPLVIKYPIGVDYVGEVQGFTQLVDIFPTVIDVSCIIGDEMKNHSGMNLVHNEEKGNKFHDYVFAEWEGRVPFFIKSKIENSKTVTNISRLTNKMWMTLNKEYKYISISNGMEELYDIKNDRSESNNIIDEDKETALSMREKLACWKSSTSKKISEEQRKIDEETRKNLEDLGYL